MCRFPRNVGIPGRRGPDDFGGTNMRRLVEDVGEPLFAGFLSRLTGATRLDRDTEWVGDREVSRELGDGDAVAVTHATADGRRRPVRYPIGLLFTALPSGGLRWWWSCPGCGAREDALYLPPDR